MRKFFTLLIVLNIFSALSVCAEPKDITIKNKLFSITMPNDTKGTFEKKVTNDTISIYHKDSKKAGFGGFTFGIKAYKNPADHATLPGGKKIGELTDKKGNLYDMVLKYPTDVQYDYIKSSEAPATFKRLYNYGDEVNINGSKGSVYYKDQGTKGKDLYQEILKKHIIAINEKWDSTKLENENMSYMYNIIPKEKIGYAYYDLNADGIEELLIGEIAEGNCKGVIYDIYTMVNRRPKHVVSGGSRNRYFACDNTFVCNEYSSGADESGIRTYILVENSTELFPQVFFKYDGYENKKSPYFISYSDKKWENVTEEYYKERKKVFEKYERFDFKPLNQKIEQTKTQGLQERYNTDKDYFDYSIVLEEFPKNYYYTTVKINKSKERILIITDKVNKNKSANRGLFYYIDKNGFVFPLGYAESKYPFSLSKKYLYLFNGSKNIKFYVSDKTLAIKKSKSRVNQKAEYVKFETIKSADRFAGDYGEPAGKDVVRMEMEGFYFEYHNSQYKKKYIKKLMTECIKDGVKTRVQMYCQMVKKLHRI